ncbi:hypothetical protein [Sphingobacterium suaedae]|uniref:Uncharacterized protein n=1 Tax=Sphingobacterium suaedae TaxID=1686402 RepID=A0ABW5KP35_9SPHI
MKSIWVAIVLGIYLPFLLGCEKTSEQNRAADEAHLTMLRTEMEAYVKDKTCSDTEDWAFVAVGNKACGGPQYYMAYPSTIDIPAFLDAVATYTDATDAFNKKYTIVSDCMFVSPPKAVHCDDGKPLLIYANDSFSGL